MSPVSFHYATRTSYILYCKKSYLNKEFRDFYTFLKSYMWQRYFSLSTGTLAYNFGNNGVIIKFFTVLEMVEWTQKNEKKKEKGPAEIRTQDPQYIIWDFTSSTGKMHIIAISTHFMPVIKPLNFNVMLTAWKVMCTYPIWLRKQNLHFETYMSPASPLFRCLSLNHSLSLLHKPLEKYRAPIPLPYICKFHSRKYARHVWTTQFPFALQVLCMS